MMRVVKESLKAAYEYISHNQRTLGIDVDFKKDYDITVLATQMGIPKEGAWGSDRALGAREMGRMISEGT
jgi:ATP-dependent Lon protease